MANPQRMTTRGSRILILVVACELELRSCLEERLSYQGYGAIFPQDIEEALTYLEAESSKVGAVLVDLTSAHQAGLETLKRIRSLDATLPLVIVSGVDSPLNTAAAFNCGATDFLAQPFTSEDLRKIIARATVERFPKDSMTTPQIWTSARSGAVFFGTHPAMRGIESQIVEIGRSDMPVLIQGETGSGKEVLARELHANSPRAGKIFVKMNCAALPSELLESELFGYERGAFTGAVQRKLGIFELAEGGTLLLDEIGDMDIRLQAKLLHVLQDSEFRRIGGREVIRVDVRVMSTTHRDLEKGITDGTFREDLYYRLNVINLFVPPLRERKEDIVPLAEYLIRKRAVSGRSAPVITQGLKHALMTYPWPGNIRELENTIRNLIVFGDAEGLAQRLHAKALPKKPEPGQDESANAQSAKAAIEVESDSVPVLDQLKKKSETEAILAALDATHWNRKQAAAVLHMDYKVFLYRMKKLGIPGKIVSSVAGWSKRAGRS